MNLHITHDDKFLDFFIQNQELYTDTKNRYLVYSNADNLKYIKNKNVEIVKPDLDSIFEKIGDLKRYEVVYIHYLSSLLMDFINSLKTDIVVVWIFWGGDGFSQIKNYGNNYCLEPKTFNFHKKNLKNKMIWCKNPIFIYKNYKRFQQKNKNIKYLNKNYVKATKRINYFAHYIYEDYLLIKNNSKLTAKYINFNYISTNQIVTTNINKIKKGGNIIIGNSATDTNNHVDIFNLLSQYNLSKTDNIYVPLSYGNEKYKQYVLNRGKLILKEKFKPLTDFMPLIEYNTMLSSISIAVFGLIRSQAAGNILALLLGGARVYMNKKNSLFILLKSEDVIIFDIDNDLEKDLENNNIYFLSEDKMLHNIKILNKIFGENSIKIKYQELLNFREKLVKQTKKIKVY